MMWEERCSCVGAKRSYDAVKARYVCCTMIKGNGGVGVRYVTVFL